MYPNEFLPHKIQGSTSKSKRYELPKKRIYLIIWAVSVQCRTLKEFIIGYESTWWMSMRITAVSLNPVLGSKDKALEWVRSVSPNAQYTAAADGKVRVNTYSVATRYISLNFRGFHIACMISLYNITFNSLMSISCCSYIYVCECNWSYINFLCMLHDEFNQLKSSANN